MSTRIIDQAYEHIYRARKQGRPLTEFTITHAELRRLISEIDGLSRESGASVLQTVPEPGSTPLRLFGLPVRIINGEPLTRADIPPEWLGHRPPKKGPGEHDGI